MLHIDGERLKASLLEMGRIGETPAGGLSRLSLSDEDREARDLFAAWSREAGLSVRVDDVGTQYARLEGTDPGAAPVLIGSHLDSVPLGGKFDGPLGVLVSLEVARTLRDAGIQPRRSVEVVNFTNEEGIRFEPSLTSSGMLSGRFTREFVYSRKDGEGRSFGDELERIGHKGSVENRPRAIHAFLEPHIEQGPVLEAEGLPLAVVDGLLGRVRMYITLIGQSQHAGPSPMRTRRDAMVAAARVVLGLRDMALEYPDPVVATVGYIQALPGAITQIPGQVTIGADLRHPKGSGLDEMVARAEELIQRAAAAERVDARVEVTSKTAPVAFDPSLLDLLESKVRQLGLPVRRMTSSAGHDAKFIAEIAPTAMIFVRTLGGKSHCETEAIDYEDARHVADVMLHAVLELAK